MEPNPWQLGTWIVAVVGGLTAAGLGILQAVQNRRQRARELRWKQADSGKQLIDELFQDDPSNSGSLMLDSWARTYPVPGAGEVRIAWKDVVQALKIESIDSDDAKSEFIRECCDTLLFHLDRFEHFIQAGLTTFEDVRTPTQYYVDLMAEDKGLWIRYIEFCKYQKISEFLDRFSQWSGTAVPYGTSRTTTPAQ
jgi:hypothetical protein